MVPIPWGDSAGSVFGAISFLCEGDWDFDEFPFLYEESPRGDIRPDALLNIHPGPGGDDLFSFTGLGVKLANLPATALIIRPWWGRGNRAARSPHQSDIRTLCPCRDSLVQLGHASSSAGPRSGSLGPRRSVLRHNSFPRSETDDVVERRRASWGVRLPMGPLGICGQTGFGIRASPRYLSSDNSPMSVSLAGIAGLALGWAVMTRPAVLVLVGPLAIVFLARLAGRSRRFVVAFLLCGLPFALLLALDNLSHTGSIWTPPSFRWVQPSPSAWGAKTAPSAADSSPDSSAASPHPPGLAGVLTLPAAGSARAPHDASTRPRLCSGDRPRDLRTLAAQRQLHGLVGGRLLGPAASREALPLLVLLSFFGAQQLPKGLRQAQVFPILVGLAIAIQAVGFFLYDSSWDAEREPTQQLKLDGDELRYMSREKAEAILWSWSESPVVDALRTGEVQFGLDTTYSLAAGSVVPAPMPACHVLRTVDRFP